VSLFPVSQQVHAALRIVKCKMLLAFMQLNNTTLLLSKMPTFRLAQLVRKLKIMNLNHGLITIRQRQSKAILEFPITSVYALAWNSLNAGAIEKSPLRRRYLQPFFDSTDDCHTSMDLFRHALTRFLHTRLSFWHLLWFY